jgi:smoothened protein
MIGLSFCAIISKLIILLNAINPIFGVISSSERNVFNQALYPLSQQSPDHCYKTAKCRTLNTSQCLDVTLPYKFTTSHVLENHSFSEIHDYLSRWKGLRSIPQCWKALQSVLCASFFPRCDNESSRVSLPTHEMCRFTRGPCRLIELHYEWPEFLRCDNETLFPPKCKNEYTDLKFNTSAIAKCVPPLVSSDDSNIHYPGIEGCALQCHNPIYTEEAHRKMSSFISHAATISLMATLFAVLTFIIDWRSSNRYPAVIIFYLNMCFLISNIGWLLQSVLSKGKNEIVCRSDNTSRYGEPGTPENFYCLLVFLLIYYFSMASLVWFVNLAYAWDLSFQTTSSQRESVNSKVAYFHLSAWSVPLMLTITILALGEV